MWYGGLLCGMGSCVMNWSELRMPQNELWYGCKKMLPEIPEESRKISGRFPEEKPPAAIGLPDKAAWSCRGACVRAALFAASSGGDDGAQERVPANVRRALEKQSSAPACQHMLGHALGHALGCSRARSGLLWAALGHALGCSRVCSGMLSGRLWGALGCSRACPGVP